MTASHDRHERHLYALMADSSVGAATTAVGVLGVELVDGRWLTTISITGQPDGESDGGWPRRLEEARRSSRGITPETIAFWRDTANGVLWDIAEIPAEDYASLDTLEAAVDVVVDEILVNPDPDPSFLGWVAGRV